MLEFFGFAMSMVGDYNPYQSYYRGSSAKTSKSRIGSKKEAKGIRSRRNQKNKRARISRRKNR